MDAASVLSEVRRRMRPLSSGDTSSAEFMSRRAASRAKEASSVTISSSSAAWSEASAEDW